MTIRVLLADDHQIVRQGLRALLASQPDVEVVAEAGDGREAVHLTEEHRPDVAVLDVSMPLLNGLEAARQIQGRVPEVAVVILSMHPDEEYVRQALQAGALGYVLKQSADSELKMAIRAAERGESFLTPGVAQTVIDGYLNQAGSAQALSRYDLLTEREREILQLVAEGKTAKEIAEVLVISPRTVATHKANLMDKLDIHHTAGLVQYAIRKGVVSLEG